jgi:cation transport ATPase
VENASEHPVARAIAKAAAATVPAGAEPATPPMAAVEGFANHAGLGAKVSWTATGCLSADPPSSPTAA